MYKEQEWWVVCIPFINDDRVSSRQTVVSTDVRDALEHADYFREVFGRLATVKVKRVIHRRFVY